MNKRITRIVSSISIICFLVTASILVLPSVSAQTDVCSEDFNYLFPFDGTNGKWYFADGNKPDDIPSGWYSGDERAGGTKEKILVPAEIDKLSADLIKYINYVIEKKPISEASPSGDLDLLVSIYQEDTFGLSGVDGIFGRATREKLKENIKNLCAIPGEDTDEVKTNLPLYTFSENIIGFDQSEDTIKVNLDFLEETINIQATGYNNLKRKDETYFLKRGTLTSEFRYRSKNLSSLQQSKIQEIWDELKIETGYDDNPTIFDKETSKPPCVEEEVLKGTGFYSDNCANLNFQGIYLERPEFDAALEEAKDTFHRYSLAFQSLLANEIIADDYIAVFDLFYNAQKDYFERYKIVTRLLKKQKSILPLDKTRIKNGGKKLRQVEKLLERLADATYGSTKILPPLKFTFEETTRETGEFDALGKPKTITQNQITDIREVNTGQKVDIFQLKRLYQENLIELLKGSITVEGQGELTIDKTQKASISASDIKQDRVDVEPFTQKVAEGEVYTGRGAGVQQLQQGKIKGVIQTSESDVLLSGLINFALSFVGALALIMLIYAGFLYITAGGDDSKIEKAKSIIIYATIGIILIIGSFTITNTVLNLTGGETEQVRIDFRLGSTILLGTNLRRNDCMYSGTVIGPVEICNQFDVLTIKTPLVGAAWPIEEIKGVCKSITIFSVCIDEEL